MAITLLGRPLLSSPGWLERSGPGRVLFLRALVNIVIRPACRVVHSDVLFRGDTRTMPDERRTLAARRSSVASIGVLLRNGQSIDHPVHAFGAACHQCGPGAARR